MFIGARGRIFIVIVFWVFLNLVCHVGGGVGFGRLGVRKVGIQRCILEALQHYVAGFFELSGTGNCVVWWG